MITGSVGRPGAIPRLVPYWLQETRKVSSAAAARVGRIVGRVTQRSRCSRAEAGRASHLLQPAQVGAEGRRSGPGPRREAPSSGARARGRRACRRGRAAGTTRAGRCRPRRAAPAAAARAGRTAARDGAGAARRARARRERPATSAASVVSGGHDQRRRDRSHDRRVAGDDLDAAQAPALGQQRRAPATRRRTRGPTSASERQADDRGRARRRAAARRSAHRPSTSRANRIATSGEHDGQHRRHQQRGGGARLAGDQVALRRLEREGRRASAGRSARPRAAPRRSR